MRYDDRVLRQLQLTELEILKRIDTVCRENGITYFLDAGTVLGAIRHGGFIPWDDDIDIAMPRPDYERFLVLAAKGIVGEDYEVVNPRIDERFAGMFAKVWFKGTKFYTQETLEAGIPQGIFVDVFPYDAVHEDSNLASKQMKKCRQLQSLSYLYHAKTISVPHDGFLGDMERAACRVLHGVARFVTNHRSICARFERVAREANAGQESTRDNGGLSSCEGFEACAYADMAYTNCGAFPHEVLFPVRPLAFEGYEFFGPADPEAYLEIMYGSTWSELPPVEKRRNHAPLELDFGRWHDGMRG